MQRGHRTHGRRAGSTGHTGQAGKQATQAARRPRGHTRQAQATHGQAAQAPRQAGRPHRPRRPRRHTGQAGQAGQAGKCRPPPPSRHPDSKTGAGREAGPTRRGRPSEQRRPDRPRIPFACPPWRCGSSAKTNRLGPKTKRPEREQNKPAHALQQRSNTTRGHGQSRHVNEGGADPMVSSAPEAGPTNAGKTPAGPVRPGRPRPQAIGPRAPATGTGNAQRPKGEATARGPQRPAGQAAGREPPDRAMAGHHTVTPYSGPRRRPGQRPEEGPGLKGQGHSSARHSLTMRACPMRQNCSA